MLEAYLEQLDLGFFEIGVAFEGLADAHVWIRPAEELLAIGELAGHIAYWEGIRLAGERQPGWPQAEPPRCKVSSPLIDNRFQYHSTTISAPPSEEHQAMTASHVRAELLRVHEESVACFRALSPDLDSVVPGWPSEWTYRESLKYLAFHVAYHCGQIYSARHLLGDQPPDN